MNDKKVMVVTGANTGLGLALVRRLLNMYGDPAVIYLTARNELRGKAAVESLNEEGLYPAFHLLDVTVEDSIRAFAEHIRGEHGGIDVLISNAAARIMPNIPKTQQVDEFINVNNHGTYRLIKHIVPLMRQGAHYIVVASSFGSLRHLKPHLHRKFDPVMSSLEDIDQTMSEYTGLVKQGEDEAEGWPEWINIPSKIGQVALMKVLARQMQEDFPKRQLRINAVCPGLVDTEASRPWFADMSSAQTPDEAAVDVVWLIDGRDALPYGELIQHRKVIAFSAAS